MYNNKYLMAIYGSDRDALTKKAIDLVGYQARHNRTSLCDLFINQVYETGVPDELVWKGRRAIQLHGIVFPWGDTLDSFAASPQKYLEKVLVEYYNDYRYTGKAFRNGSYIGFVFDENSQELVAFTCFLNTIPLYYTFFDGCLILSSDFYLIARLCDVSIDDNHTGLAEYLVQGVNLSESTALPKIKHLTPGSYLKLGSAGLETGHYITMQEVDNSLTFKQCLNQFTEKWESHIRYVGSSKFKYGLGLTGGFDSRVILAALEDRGSPLLFTGSSRIHPDYILASHIANHIGLDNHVLEEHHGDMLKGFAEYCAMEDNPTLNNFSYVKQQMDFRGKHRLAYELRGGTEFIGGCSYFTQRRTALYALRKSLPVQYHRFRGDFKHFRELVSYAIGTNYENELKEVNPVLFDEYLRSFEQSSEAITKQINPNGSQETFLERFRCIYIMNTLHIGSRLGGRRYCELIAPGICYDLIDFASKVPLAHKENRKLLIAYLKNSHPELSRFVTRGHIFPLSYPWIFFKTIFPYVEDLNAVGLRIPILQWYMRKEYLKKRKDKELSLDLQLLVCRESPIVTNTWLSKFLKEENYDQGKLMRLFKIAMLEKRLQAGEDGVRDYLFEKIESISSNEKSTC